VSVPAIEIDRAYEACERITRLAAANFYYGIRLLPRPKRQAMCAVYAFARRVDDIADDPFATAEGKLERLAAERARVAALADGGWTTSADPVTLALGHVKRHYQLPVEALGLLIDGVELDVRATRYETFEQLVVYCRGVAGSIGRLSLAVFTGGAAANGAAALADELGVAMQLTNILRDIREDAERGRSYIPAEDLERFGCRAGAATPPPELIRFEVARARAWFERGLGLVELLEPRSAACVLAMTGIYREILERIARDPGVVLRGRVALPAWQKTWVAARSLAGAMGIQA
jgi:phytoene synthase